MAPLEYPYTCKAKGHEGDRTFMAAPPDWWKAKGLSTPKKCNACREWINAQKDEAIQCKRCGRNVYFEARKKVAHFLFKGVWKTPTVSACERCKSNAILDTKLSFKTPREVWAKRMGLDPTECLPSSYALITDMHYYTVSMTRDSSGEPETRADHLAHHLPDAPEVTNPPANKPLHTATTLGNTTQEVLDNAARIASSGDEEWIIETGSVIQLLVHDERAGERIVFKPRNRRIQPQCQGDYELQTAYAVIAEE